MVNGGFFFEQVGVVLGVVDGAVDVGAGEGGDGVEGIPKGQGEEFGFVAVDAAEGADAAVARCLSVVFEAGGEQVGEVGVGIGGGDATSPDAGDHGWHSFLPG